MKVWIVGELVKKMPITVDGLVSELEMKWASGMLGVMPVFESAKDAEAYAKKQEEIHGGKREVWSVEKMEVE